MIRFRFTRDAVPGAAARHGRLMLRGLGAVALVAVALPAFAQAQGGDVDGPPHGASMPEAAQSAEQTLPGLDAITAVSGYPLAHDRSFNYGNWYGDAFAGNSNNNLLGRRVVRLSNGDVVVAGLVPAVGATNTYGNNLGLVRYNSAGVRVPWANINPAGFGHYNKNYIIVPNSTTAGYTEVVDMVATGAPKNQILVLLNHTSSGGAKTVELRSFSYDGEVNAPVYNVLTKDGQPSTGAGLVYYQDNKAADPAAYKVVVIGTRFENGMGRIVYRRLAVVPGFAFETGVQNVHPAGLGDCSTTIQTGGCIATAVNSVQWSAWDWLPPRIYITGVVTRNLLPDDTDYFVTRLIGGDNVGVGYWDSSFGTGGTRRVVWDKGDNNRDYPTAVVAYRSNVDHINTSDRVYAVGQVAQTCRPGIGVAAFNHDGTAYTGIGAGGKLLFGGTSISCDQAWIPSADYANAATVGQTNPVTIVIAGMSVWKPRCIPIPGHSCGEDNVDPMLAVVGADNGAVLEQRDFPVQPGGRIRHGGLYDIVNSGTNGFTVTGDDRYFETDPNVPGRQEFVTGRFTLDRIFGNGFE